MTATIETALLTATAHLSPLGLSTIPMVSKAHKHIIIQKEFQVRIRTDTQG